MKRELKKGAVIIVCIIIVVFLSVFLYLRNKENKIESKLICTESFENNNNFIQLLIKTEEDLHKYGKEYGFTIDNKEINFDKEAIFVCSIHKPEKFSYSKKNTTKSDLEVLDIVFHSEREDKIYIYTLKKNNIILWEATGANKEDVFQ